MLNHNLPEVAIVRNENALPFDGGHADKHIVGIVTFVSISLIQAREHLAVEAICITPFRATPF